MWIFEITNSMLLNWCKQIVENDTDLLVCANIITFPLVCNVMTCPLVCDIMTCPLVFDIMTWPLVCDIMTQPLVCNMPWPIVCDIMTCLYVTDVRWFDSLLMDTVKKHLCTAKISEKMITAAEGIPMVGLRLTGYCSLIYFQAHVIQTKWQWFWDSAPFWQLFAPWKLIVVRRQNPVCLGDQWQVQHPCWFSRKQN